MRPELIISKMTLSLLFKSGRQTAFKSGDIIDARVIRKFPDNKVLLEVKGNFIKASVNNTMLEGDTVKLLLKSMGQKIVFEILPQKIQANAEKIRITDSTLKGIIKTLSDTSEGLQGLKHTLNNPDSLFFLSLLFSDSEADLIVDWEKESKENGKDARQLKLAIDMKSIGHTLVVIRETEKDISVSAFFSNGSIKDIAENLKGDFYNRTGLNLNMHIMKDTLKSEINELFVKSRSSASSFDFKI